MNPIEKLRAEHQVILRGIYLLERGIARLELGQNIPADYFRKSIDFIRNYSDKYHHAKEEDILFVKLGKMGFSPDQGPIAVMLYEHDQGRAFISALEQANEKYANGDKHAIKDITRNARNYAGLLKQHIQKEDVVLYPMAENALGDQGINNMQPDFDRVENEQPGVEQKYIDLLKELEKS